MSELDHFVIWAQHVKRLKNWPEPTLWTNHQFQVLSEEISEKSNILINRNTIRVLVERVNSGKPYNPHAATKDAFAQYIGFDNWDHFVNEKSKKTTIKKNPLKIFWLPSLVAVIGIAFGAYLFLNTDSSKINFQIANPEGTAPHTIECKYDLKQLKTDNIIIDFGHINTNGQYILANLNKDNTTQKECFHYPGGYNIRLFVDNKVRIEEKVWINSADWFIYANDARPYITEIELPDFLKKAGVPSLQNIPFESLLKRTTDSSGYFHIPQERMEQIKDLSVNYHTHLKNFRSFGVDSRNCEFKIRFKDAQFGIGTFCHETVLYLHGVRGDIGFKFAEQGCERYTHQRIGNSFHSANTEDLSYLVLDFKEFKTITIKCSPTEVKLMVDGKIIKTIADDQILGEVRGLDFWFKGSPFIDFVELADSSGTVVYADYFDELP